MYLKKLTLLNFKNYSQKEIELSEKINCFVGKNGVGKTNILDAIYYLSFCKSFLNPIDSQNIKHNEDLFVIQGEYDKADKVENVYCGVKRNTKKQFKRNQKEYQKLSDHIGLFPLVIISPIDYELITGGSEERRKFVSGIIAQYNKNYLEALIKYNKALTHRNKLLKSFAKTGKFDQVSIDIWNEQLVIPGELIFKEREKFIKKFIPIFQKYYNYISLQNEKVDLKYESDLQTDNLNNLFINSIEKDRILQYTTKGVHKDDLIFNISNHPIKKIGSQGQQKSYLIALKLAQFDFINEINHYKPILLLDDIFDKLDSERVKQIVNLVAEENFGQIFITDTNQERLEKILKDVPIEFKLFNLSNNK
ncbi:DNA replication/repair protein RecF [Bacteroidota bacterium]